MPCQQNTTHTNNKDKQEKYNALLLLKEKLPTSFLLMGTAFLFMSTSLPFS